MMSKFFRTGSSLAIAIAAMAGTAHAQTADTTAQATAPAPVAQDDDYAGNEIIVTATKRAESLSDVPMSITAISGEALADKGITSVQDLVKITPGLSYAESGLGTPVYSLRGVGFFETSIGARPTVSVYSDEAPLPFSVMAQGAAFDLERVEILKGPQGTLFGQNSTGGAINYIAAKPKDVWGGGMTMSYARFNAADIQGYVTGPLSSNLNVRVAARTAQGGDWQKSYTRNATRGGQNFSQGRVLLDWQATERLKLSFNANGFIDKGDTQAAQLIGILYVGPARAGEVPLLGTYPLAPADARAADWDANPQTRYKKDTKFYQGVVRGDYEISDAITLTSLTAWSRIDMNQNSDVDGTALPSSDIAVVGKVTSFSTEARLAGDHGPLRWIVGASYAREHSVENDYIHFPYTSSLHAFTPLYNYSETNPYTTQNFLTKAVFGSMDLTFGQFTLHGGLRYTKADLDYTGCTKVNDDASGAAITTLFNNLRTARGLSALPFLRKGQCQSLDATLTPNLRVGTFNQDNLSWRAGVDWKPNRDVMLYANVSRGYKAGSVPAPGAINLEEFDPVNQESLLAYEAGFKLSLANRTIDITGAAFYYDYTDKQLLARRITTPNLLGALPALINVPKSEIKGAEAQINFYPTKGLTLTAAATWLESKVTSNFVNYTILATQENFKGNPFPYTPKWQVVLDGQYKFPLNEGLTAMVGGNVNYRSNTSAGFGTHPYLKVDAYTLVDLRAGIEDPDGKWSAQVFGRNITNEYYWTNVAKFNDTVRRYSGMPATYGVQFGFKF
ncbi:MAG: TonB-dependent receptor [Sphingomonadales bacterium]|nr:MAG: TonB-dependent receptor [Sphingomonadales bacterium]